MNVQAQASLTIIESCTLGCVCIRKKKLNYLSIVDSIYCKNSGLIMHSVN